MADPITLLANTLMRAVVRAGCIRSADKDGDIAVRVMREELKAFVAGPAYADERELAKTGGHQLAMASLVTACVSRILAERVPA